jgi:hypothetical protein
MPFASLKHTPIVLLNVVITNFIVSWECSVVAKNILRYIQRSNHQFFKTKLKSKVMSGDSTKFVLSWPFIS